MQRHNVGNEWRPPPPHPPQNKLVNWGREKALITHTPTTASYTLCESTKWYLKNEKTLLAWIYTNGFLVWCPWGTLEPPAPHANKNLTAKHVYRSANDSKPRRCTRHSVPACVSYRQCPSMIQSCSYFRARGGTISLVLSQQRAKQAQTTESSSVFQSPARHAESQSLQRFSLK